MATRTILTTEIPEGTTPVIGCRFLDDDGVLITNVLTATVTLYLERDGSIINNRNATNLLAGGLNVVTAGVMSWRLDPADTILPEVDSTLLPRFAPTPYRKVIALVEWTWTASGGVTGYGKHEIELHIKNLDQVP